MLPWSLETNYCNNGATAAFPTFKQRYWWLQRLHARERRRCFRRRRRRHRLHRHGSFPELPSSYGLKWTLLLVWYLFASVCARGSTFRPAGLVGFEFVLFCSWPLPRGHPTHFHWNTSIWEFSLSWYKKMHQPAKHTDGRHRKNKIPNNSESRKK